METAFGACDIREHDAILLCCDAILHIGHSDFGVRTKIPVVYEEYEIDFNPVPLLEKRLKALEKYKKISLLTTVQFEKSLEPAKALLEENGKQVLFSKNKKTNKKGVVLGCDFTAALPLENEVDCFLFIGSGKFHPLGLAMRTEKPVLSLDFESGELVDFKKEKARLQKIRAFHIAQAGEAKSFGILVSTKPGQFFPEKVESVRKALRERGKKVWVLVMDEISPEKIQGMKLDALVNCACPRIGEDSSLLKKPIISPEDVSRL